MKLKRVYAVFLCFIFLCVPSGCSENSGAGKTDQETTVKSEESKTDGLSASEVNEILQGEWMLQTGDASFLFTENKKVAYLRDGEMIAAGTYTIDVDDSVINMEFTASDGKTPAVIRFVNSDDGIGLYNSNGEYFIKLSNGIAASETTTAETTTAEPTTAEPKTTEKKEEAGAGFPAELRQYADGLTAEGKTYRVSLSEADWYINYRSSPVYIPLDEPNNNIAGKMKHGTEIYVEYIYDGTWAVFRKDGAYVFSSIYSLNDPSKGRLLVPVSDASPARPAGDPGSTSQASAVSEADQYTSMACMDFHVIRNEYPKATANAAYAVAFSANFDGEQKDYLLVLVKYEIISDYSETFLHNLTDGGVRRDPYRYYNELADRAFGGRHVFYLDVAINILEMEQLALEGINQGLLTGQQTGSGVFIPASLLNM